MSLIRKPYPFLGKAEGAAQNIQRQIEFTKNYEEIGVRAPQWQNVGTLLEGLRPGFPQPGWTWRSVWTGSKCMRTRSW